MHAKFLKAAGAMLVGAAFYIAPISAQAEDAGVYEPGGAHYVEASTPANSQGQGQGWTSEQLSELPGQQQQGMSGSPASAESQGYFFMADPAYPQDFPEGGSD